MASVDKKIIDCFWYLQNQCVKGESCEYRHWAPALENPLVCPQWTDGKCQNKECNFRHPSANMAKKATVCYYFTHGGCMKGSSCPFSHDVDVDAVATQDLEAAKKKEEEELRRLKEERRREEERIAKLKTEELSLQKKKNQEAKQARQGAQKVQQRNSKDVQEVYRPKGSKPQQKNTEQSSGFVKSFEEIQREKLQKQLQEEKKKKPTETIQRKEEPQKKILKQRGTKAKEQPAESNDTPSFGVKSFAEILKERQNPASNGTSTTSPETKTATPTPNQPAPSKASSPPAKRASNLKSLEDLRKKNQEKFKSSPSPAKRPAESPIGSPQQKKLKPSEPTPAPSTTPKTEEKEIDLDFEIGSTGDDEVNIDDDFDKEFNELESLMEA